MKAGAKPNQSSFLVRIAKVKNGELNFDTLVSKACAYEGND